MKTLKEKRISAFKWAIVSFVVTSVLVLFGLKVPAFSGDYSLLINKAFPKSNTIGTNWLLVLIPLFFFTLRYCYLTLQETNIATYFKRSDWFQGTFVFGFVLGLIYGFELRGEKFIGPEVPIAAIIILSLIVSIIALAVGNDEYGIISTACGVGGTAVATTFFYSIDKLGYGVFEAVGATIATTSISLIIQSMLTCSIIMVFTTLEFLLSKKVRRTIIDFFKNEESKEIPA